MNFLEPVFQEVSSVSLTFEWVGCPQWGKHARSLPWHPDGVSGKAAPGEGRPGAASRNYLLGGTCSSNDLLSLHLRQQLWVQEGLGRNFGPKREGGGPRESHTILLSSPLCQD